MDQKFVSFYVGAVCPENLAFSIPKENRLNVEAQLMAENRLNHYIIIDPEELERQKQQQEALRAKLAQQNNDPAGAQTPESKPVPRRKKPTTT